MTPVRLLRAITPPLCVEFDALGQICFSELQTWPRKISVIQFLNVVSCKKTFKRIKIGMKS